MSRCYEESPLSMPVEEVANGEWGMVEWAFINASVAYFAGWIVYPEGLGWRAGIGGDAAKDRLMVMGLGGVPGDVILYSVPHNPWAKAVSAIVSAAGGAVVAHQLKRAEEGSYAPPASGLGSSR
jgi:hypothetical protein